MMMCFRSSLRLAAAAALLLVFVLGMPAVGGATSDAARLTGELLQVEREQPDAVSGAVSVRGGVDMREATRRASPLHAGRGARTLARTARQLRCRLEALEAAPRSSNARIERSLRAHRGPARAPPR